MTTAAFIPAASPLSFVAAETALAAYQLACATGAPESYEAAAHALAGALRCERARRMAPRPAAGPGPRLVVDNDPKGQSASPVARSSRKSALAAGPDMDAAVAMPKRAAAFGAFVVEWSDGSSTRVQGVTWPGSKPATRWVRAYQVANRVRRVRLGRDLVRDLEGPAGNGESILTGRLTTGCAGQMVESADWRALLASLPLPTLAAVVDETTGERFDAVEAGRWGGGDTETARLLEQRVCSPRLPWAAAEAAKSNRLYGSNAFGLSYWIARGEGEDAVHGCGVMTPWPHAYRKAMIQMAEDAFALPVVPAEEAAVIVGEAVQTTDAGELAGQRVTMTAEAWDALRQTESDARTAYENADPETDPEAKAALILAMERTKSGLGAAVGLAWTLRRAPGGDAMLERPGRGVVVRARDLPLLHLVANPSA